MRKLIILHFMLLFVSDGKAQISDDVYYRKKAIYFYKYNEYDSAYRYFKLSIIANPKQTTTYTGIGDCCLHLRKHKEAIAFYRIAIKTDMSNIGNIYSGLAAAYGEISYYDSAIYFMTQYVLLNPQTSLGYEMLGDCYKGALKYKQAFQEYKKAISLGRIDFTLLISTGAMAVRLNNLPAAIDYYSQAISLKPLASEGYLRRSDAYRLANKTAEAYSDVDKAISLDSTNYKGYGIKALLLYEEKKYADCLFYCNKYLALDTSNAEIWAKKGSCEYLLELNDPVILEDLNKAISLNNKLVEAYYYRGAYFYRNNEFGRAYEDFSKVVLLDPKNTLGKEWKNKTRSKIKG